MKNPLRITAAFLIIYAGLLAIQHGIFESLQGSRAPGGLMFDVIGLPCQAVPGSAGDNAVFADRTLQPVQYTA